MRPRIVRSLKKLYYILLVTFSLNQIQSRSVEAHIYTYAGWEFSKAFQADRQVVRDLKNFHSAGLYSISVVREQIDITDDRESLLEQLSRRIQRLLLGGGIFVIGTFFIPHLIPQFAGYHERLSRFFGNTLKKAFRQNSQRRVLSHSAITNAFPEEFQNTRQNVPLFENKEAAMRYYAIRCKNILSPATDLPMSKSSTVGFIRKFFQQSGFTFTKISDT